MTEDFLVIRDWLPDDEANSIADRIEQIQDWGARICDRNGGPRIIESSAMKSLGLTPEEYAKSHPLSLESLAVGGTMAYLFFVKHLSVFDPDLFQRWEKDTVTRVNEITGQDNNYFEEPQVTMYTSGCFLGQHTDGVGDRQIACMTNFTRNWQPDFGGCVTVLSKGVWQVIPPVFNSMILMNVRAANCHYVSQVSSWVKHKRISITGWVGRR